MASGETLNVSLRKWIDDNLPAFLNNLSAEVESENPWEMPIIEDYILVVAVKDFKDGLGNIFCIGDASVPDYRTRGLLGEALAL